MRSTHIFHPTFGAKIHIFHKRPAKNEIFHPNNSAPKSYTEALENRPNVPLNSYIWAKFYRKTPKSFVFIPHLGDFLAYQTYYCVFLPQNDNQLWIHSSDGNAKWKNWNDAWIPIVRSSSSSMADGASGKPSSCAISSTTTTPFIMWAHTKAPKRNNWRISRKRCPNMEVSPSSPNWTLGARLLTPCLFYWNKASIRKRWFSSTRCLGSTTKAAILWRHLNISGTVGWPPATTSFS